MRRSLRFASLSVLFFLIVQLQTSCSPRISGEGGTVPPAIELTAEEGSQKYNIQLDFMKHHFSGPKQVRIRHPWIRLTIQLDKLPKDN